MGDLTIWNSGVWLIPLILAAVVVGTLLLVRRWQNKTTDDLKQLRSELRKNQSRRRQLASLIAPYAGDPQEPFASALAGLEDSLAKIDEQMTAMEVQHVAMQEDLRALASNAWQATLGAPFYWYGLRQQVKQQWGGQEALQNALDTADAAVGKLSRLPLDVSAEARQARDLHTQLSRLIDKIKAEGVHGETLETGLRERQELKAVLDSIPDYFFAEEEDRILQESGVADTAEAFEVLAKARPALDQLLARAQAWEEQYTLAVKNVTEMRQYLGILEQTLEAVPSGLELEPLERKFSQLSVIAHNLKATLSRMEIESLEQVAQEAARVLEAAREIDTQIKRARQQLGALQTRVEELSEARKALSAQFATLGRAGAYPILWETSRAKLTNLSRQVKELESLGENRPPERVEQDLATAVRLRERQRELTRHFAEIGRQHDLLLALLNRPALQGAEAWLQEARGLARQVAQYDFENWPRAESVATLPADLQRLADDRQRLAGSGPEERIPESALAERVQAAQQLVQEAQALRERMGRIRRRLEEVRQQERQTVDRLEAARTTLNQINILIRSNPVLTQAAAQESERFLGEAQTLHAELQMRQRGAVEKKARAVEGLIGRIESAGEKWLQQLIAAIGERVTTLGEKANQLKEIGSLDEQAVSEAQRLLANSAAHSSEKPAFQTENSLNQLLLELKRRSEYWQDLTAAISRLEELEPPLLESYAEVVEYRAYAQEQLTGYNEWLRGGRGWPPTSLGLDQATREFEAVEKQRRALQSQPIKAIDLVRQLGNLSHKYHSVAEKAARTAERIYEEQQKVAGLEEELDQLVGQWQGQLQSYASSPETAKAIRELIHSINDEYNRIQREARQGRLNYDQTVRELEELRRRARIAQVPFDDSHVLDINGRQIASPRGGYR